ACAWCRRVLIGAWRSAIRRIDESPPVANSRNKILAGDYGLNAPDPQPARSASAPPTREAEEADPRDIARPLRPPRPATRPPRRPPAPPTRPPRRRAA